MGQSRPELLNPEEELQEIKEMIRKGKPKEIFSSSNRVLTVNSPADFEPVIDRDWIKNEQLQDEYVKKIRKAMKDNLAIDFKFSEDLDGIPYKDRDRNERNDKVVVPLSMRRKLLKAYHDSPFSSHLGVQRTYQKLKREYYWNNIVLVVDFVK